MTTNVYKSTGLTINISSNPNLSQELLTPNINEDDNLAERASSYNHQTDALGGYISAQLSLSESRQRAFDWLGALGKFLYVYSPSGKQIFRALVNTVTLRAGMGTIVSTALMDIANRVRIVYSPIVDSNLINIQGGRLFTDYANDLDSQAQYGVWVKDVSGGALSDPMAINDRNDYLARFAFPKFNKTINTGSGSTITVQIDALGIWPLLLYPYTDLNAGTIAITTKLTDVLNDNPNVGFISSNYGYVFDNTETVVRQELGDRLAQAIIKELLGQPDNSGNRMLFGFYEDGLAYYQQKPTEVAYQVNLDNTNPFFQDSEESYVDPWNVAPGQWLYYSNLFPGGKVNTFDLERDPRAEFIETVRFTAPNIIEANGNVYTGGDARINAKGLKGI